MVYFQDNAVGTGTGKYKDRQLFRARQNHASLVPIMGLMKEAEFYQTVNPPQNYSEYSVNSDKYGGGGKKRWLRLNPESFKEA